MKLKTSELQGAALDWAVALANGQEEFWTTDNYSTNWALGGPIIEDEGIDIHRVNSSMWSARWWPDNSGMVKNPAQRFRHNIQMDGPTPLIAAMRCYVTSKLGDEIEVPEELK